MTLYIFVAIAISAVITYALRSAVFVFFRGDRTMPAWLERLGDVLPSAVMGVLVVYCLRGIRDDITGSGIWGVIAAVITGISYKLFHNTFLSIILGTAAYMVMIRLL